MATDHMSHDDMSHHIITLDLSLDKHVSDVSGKCFFQLRQIRQIRRSLDDESAATLVFTRSSLHESTIATAS